MSREKKVGITLVHLGRSRRGRRNDRFRFVCVCERGEGGRGGGGAPRPLCSFQQIEIRLPSRLATSIEVAAVTFPVLCEVQVGASDSSN